MVAEAFPMSASEFARLKELERRCTVLEAKLAAFEAKWGNVSSAPTASSDKVGEKSTLSLKKAV